MTHTAIDPGSSTSSKSVEATPESLMIQPPLITLEGNNMPSIKLEDILLVLEHLRNAAHQNSKDKGFWDAPLWNFGEKIALVHSELSEMFEAWRKNIKESDKDISIYDPKCATTNEYPVNYRRITAIEEEMADTFIRLFDLCGKLNIDVGRVILAKMDYNATREHMHGGRKC